MKKIMGLLACLIMLSPCMPVAGASESGFLPLTSAAYAAGSYAQLAARLAGGGMHAAAVMTDGTVETWGDNGFGQLAAPAGAVGVKALAAGAYHTLALKEDGMIVGWGLNQNGQCDTPAVLAGVKVKALAAWEKMSAVLGEDNKIIVWGCNSREQRTFSQVLTSTETIVSIDMNSNYVLALTGTGMIEAWNWVDKFQPCELPEEFSEHVVAMAAGERHVLALKADGRVFSWNSNDYDYPVPAGLANVRAIAAGVDYSAALTDDGKVIVWGGNSALLAVPAELAGLQALAAGYNSLYALQSDGTVIAWGRNGKGQCDVPEQLDLFNAVSANNRLSSLSAESVSDIDGVEHRDTCGIYPQFSSEEAEGVIDVAYETREVRLTAGTFSGKAALEINAQPAVAGVATVINAQDLAVGDNPIQITVKAENGSERCYILHIKRVKEGYVLPQTPQAYRESEPAAYARLLSAGGEHCLALNEDGAVAAWGSSSCGQSNMPAGLDAAVAVAAGFCHSLALKKDGSVVAWGGQGHNNHGQSDVPSGLSQVAAIAAGNFFSAAVDRSGRVYAWGDNTCGQCDVPAGLKQVVEIRCGAACMLALQADGTVAAWGDNAYGQCDVPAGLDQVVSIAAGKTHCVALKADGTVVTWGKAQIVSDKLGTAFQHPDLCYVRAIAAGDRYAAALKWDGSLVVWGNNNGRNIDFDFPLQPDKEILAISAGPDHLLALKADGTVAAWGNPLHLYKGNFYGQCNVPVGLNLFSGAVAYSGPSPDIARTPAAYAASAYGRAAAKISRLSNGVTVLNRDGTVKVALLEKDDYGLARPPAGLGKVKAIASAYFNVMALKEDGSVAVWGNNQSGQCEVPASARDVTAVAVNGVNSYCLALKADGTVVAWGGNDYRQRDVPSSLCNVTAIAAGETHCLALKKDGTVAAWGNNDYGQCGVPPGLNNVARIFAGCNFSLALTNDGAVIAWGSNNSSEQTYYSGQCDVPAGLNGVVDIAVSGTTCTALKNNGTVTVWGNNYYGCRNVPTGLHGVVAVSKWAGVYAVKADGTVVVWGKPSSFNEAQLTGLNDVLTISQAVVISRDGSLKKLGMSSYMEQINESLAGANVLIAPVVP